MGRLVRESEVSIFLFLAFLHLHFSFFLVVLFQDLCEVCCFTRSVFFLSVFRAVSAGKGFLWSACVFLSILCVFLCVSLCLSHFSRRERDDEKAKKTDEDCSLSFFLSCRHLHEPRFRGLFCEFLCIEKVLEKEPRRLLRTRRNTGIFFWRKFVIITFHFSKKKVSIGFSSLQSVLFFFLPSIWKSRDRHHPQLSV